MIQIMDVKKSFGAEEVLHGITREFEPGKIHGIVGNNGSGKTVLMKCICGFLRPTSGRVLVDGKEVGKDMDFPENLGAIIETPGFLPNLTGLKNLKLLASLRGKIGEEQIRSSLRRVGLDPDLKKTVVYTIRKSDLYASGIEPTREILDIAGENENVDFTLVLAKILRELTAQTGNIT